MHGLTPRSELNAFTAFNNSSPLESVVDLYTGSGIAIEKMKVISCKCRVGCRSRHCHCVRGGVRCGDACGCVSCGNMSDVKGYYCVVCTRPLTESEAMVSKHSCPECLEMQTLRESKLRSLQWQLFQAPK